MDHGDPCRGQVNNAKKDDAKTPAEAQSKAARLLRDIQGGQDFALVARDWSEIWTPRLTAVTQLSIIGTISKSIDPKLKAAVQRLKVGESSPLIETAVRLPHH